MPITTPAGVSSLRGRECDKISPGPFDQLSAQGTRWETATRGRRQRGPNMQAKIRFPAAKASLTRKPNRTNFQHPHHLPITRPAGVSSLRGRECDKIFLWTLRPFDQLSAQGTRWETPTRGRRQRGPNTPATLAPQVSPQGLGDGSTLGFYLREGLAHHLGRTTPSSSHRPVRATASGQFSASQLSKTPLAVPIMILKSAK